MQLTEQQLNNLNGGAVSAAYINALIRAASFIYDLGRSFGTTLRQGRNKRICKI